MLWSLFGVSGCLPPPVRCAPRTDIFSFTRISFSCPPAQLRYGIYSNGNYGTDRNTNVQIGLPALSLETGDFKFNVSMPYMRISGRGLVVFDAAGNPIVINRRTSLPPDVRTGFGDLQLQRLIHRSSSNILDGFEVTLTGSTKLPTASERRRLSTGEADFGMSVDISRQYGAWGPFLTSGLSRSWPAQTYNSFYITRLGIGRHQQLAQRRSGRHRLPTIGDSASTPLVTASHELFGSLSWLRSGNLTLTGYGTIGLSTGSPNIGGGLLVSYGLN